MISPTLTFTISIIAGMLPPLVWLWFWLREDRVHPEPKRLIFLSFLLGMAVVPLIIPLQHFSQNIFGIGLVTIILWASIEEIGKFIAAYIGGIHTQADDEPIDAVIYLVTAALGFAALENMLFLLSPIAGGTILEGLVAGNLRFIGATVLHTVATGAIGVSMALSFYSSRLKKFLYLIVGFVVAILLHALFNIFILQSAKGGFVATLLFVWVMVIIMILFLEKVKRFTRKHNKEIQKSDV